MGCTNPVLRCPDSRGLDALPRLVSLAYGFGRGLGRGAKVCMRMGWLE